MPFLTFYITHPDEATARRIAGELVQERWAACANIFPIHSAYWWNGAVQNDAEWVSVSRPALRSNMRWKPKSNACTRMKCRASCVSKRGQMQPTNNGSRSPYRENE